MSGKNIKEILKGDYWLEKLRGMESSICPAVKKAERSIVRVPFADHILAKVQAISNGEALGRFLIYLGGVKVLNRRLNRGINLAIATGNFLDADSSAPIFYTSLLNSELSAKDLLKALNEELKLNYANRDYNSEELAQRLGNTYFLPALSLSCNSYTKPFVDICPLDISITEKEGSACLQISSDIYNEEWLLKLAKGYLQILSGFISKGSAELKSLKMLSDEEEQQVLAFNYRRNNDTPSTISVCFDKVVAEYGSKTVLRSEDKAYTYQELDDAANRLAFRLTEEIQKGEVVGVITHETDELIISLLAILKAGGVYLPIDPSFPTERIKYIVEDSACKLVLSGKGIMVKEVRSYVIGDLLSNEDFLVSVESGSQPGDPAYIIYTSGTTGKPKGVVCSHGGLTNMALSQINSLGFNAKDVFLQFASASFDASLYEIFLALFSGGQLTFADSKQRKDIVYMRSFIERFQVSVVTLPPAFLALFEKDLPACVHTVITAGERAHVEDALFYGKARKYINAYGPTEASVCSSFYEVKADKAFSNIPIGSAIDNVNLYVLDTCQHLLPVGFTGELYIGGSGVALQYWRNETLTNERFIADPFLEGKKMYRTGDLVCWNAEGNLEFIGRADEQLKVRSYRIEPGEIESAMLEIGGVKQAFVTTSANSENEIDLIAYYADNNDVKIDFVRDHLKGVLPQYMIPSRFIRLDHLPLTHSGKINKALLPASEENVAITGVFVPPQSEVQEKLYSIWKEVLNHEHFGIYENFFEVGGQSLRATKLITRIYKCFQVDIPLWKVFDHPTIEKLSEYISSLKTSVIENIQPANERSCYPLAAAQKRMFLINQLEGSSTTYNMPLILRVKGKLDIEKVKNVFKLLLERHEILRTSFEILNEQPVQRIHPQVSFDVKVIHSKESEIIPIIKDLLQPFDLSSSPLFRSTILKLSEAEAVLFLDMHHIISDGISVALITEEFIKLYQGQALQPLSIQYKDYAVWQQETAISSLSKQQDFWLNTLSGELPVLDLPLDYERPPVKSQEGKRFDFTLDKDLTEPLRNLAHSFNTTYYSLFLSFFHLLLSKYAQQEDIIIGTPVGGRTHPALEGMMGMFVNTIPVRNQVNEEEYFPEFIERVKSNVAQALSNQDYPFEELIEKLAIKRDTTRNPLFDVMFSFETSELAGFNLEGLTFSPVALEESTSKFDLMLKAGEERGCFVLSFEYCTRLFKQETIETFARRYQQLIKGILSSPQARIKDIDWLSTQEKQQVLFTFNTSKSDLPKHALPELFESVVKISPNKTAIKTEHYSCSYTELNDKAEAVAAELLKNGIRHEEVVAVWSERNIETIADFIGILKAGAAYLPLDTDAPLSRIQEMLSDSGVRFVIGAGSQAERLTGLRNITFLTHDKFVLPHNQSKPSLSNQNLAYVMYTSGSTGKPKGVMIEHKSIVRLVKNPNYIDFSRYNHILQTGALSFDATTFEIWGALLNGGTLYLTAKETLLDAPSLKSFLGKNPVNTAWFTSGFFNGLMDADPDLFKTFEYLIVGGDRLSTTHIDAFKKRYPDTELVNGYGPTENTTFSTFFPVDVIDSFDIPIGKPVSDTRVYVVDRYLNPLPAGIPGELCIAGEGLARGYINDKKLSDEKFLPVAALGENRVYRSGDIACWTDNGNIRFVGRKDEQVKLRGFRIELHEIEHRIKEIDGISDAIVILNDDRNKLCAYIVASSFLSEKEIIKYLRLSLSDYMLPDYFCFLESLPLNKNGKVDRANLPQIIKNEEEDFVLPSTDIEKHLVEIWKDLLGIEKVSITDNFFMLGGDSIKAIQVSARLRNHNLKLETRDLLQYPTVAELASYVKPLTVMASQEPLVGEVKPIPIQHWFFERKLSEAHHWNQSVMLFSEKGFEQALLEETFLALSLHHDALRAFVQEERLYCKDPANFHVSLVCFDLRNNTSPGPIITREAEKIQSSISLEQGPLFKLGLFKTKEGDHLLIAVHHLIVDGVSWRIIFEDIVTAYSALAEKRTVQFPFKTHSIADWSEQLYAYSSSKKLVQEVNFWESMLKSEIKTLPKYKPSGPGKVKTAESVSFSLNEEITRHLLQDVHRAYSTEINDILLAALSLALGDFSESTNVLINLEGHGREDVFENIDLSRTVGWFTSSYPVVLGVRESDVSYHIRQTKEILRKIPDKGLGYGVLKYLNKSGRASSDVFSIEPEVCFNYLGQFDSDIDENVFSISPYSEGNAMSPESERSFNIDISGIVAAGKLSITITYNPDTFLKTSMLKLSQAYEECLHLIISHCLNKENSELTPADLGYGELSLEGLDKISALLENKIK